MTYSSEITLGDLIAAASFLAAAIALVLTLYQLRRDSIRKKAEFTTTALTAQLAMLVQIQAMPEGQRLTVWNAIAEAEGGPGPGFPIETAIAIQVQYLDRIAQGQELTNIPTYSW